MAAAAYSPAAVKKTVAGYGQADKEQLRFLMQHELNLIARLKYEPYFLTVNDIVAFARSRDILTHVLGSATRMIVVGLVVGLAGALALTRVMESLLFQVSALDPTALGVACASMAILSLVAFFLIGWALVALIDVEQGRRQAREAAEAGEP